MSLDLRSRSKRNFT